MNPAGAESPPGPAGVRRIPLDRVRTLWVDTGSGADDGLAYFRLADLEPYLAEIGLEALGTEEVAFVGRDPFADPELLPMIDAALARGLSVSVRTEVRGSIGRVAGALLDLHLWHPGALTVALVLPHHTPAGYEAALGPGAWQLMLDVVAWLGRHDFRLTIEGGPGDDASETAREGYARLVDELDLMIDLDDPRCFALSPDWPGPQGAPKCSCGRTVVRRWGGAGRTVRACPILPDGDAVEFGRALGTARRTVSADHPACAACIQP